MAPPSGQSAGSRTWPTRCRGYSRVRPSRSNRTVPSASSRTGSRRSPDVGTTASRGRERQRTAVFAFDSRHLVRRLRRRSAQRRRGSIRVPRNWSTAALGQKRRTRTHPGHRRTRGARSRPARRVPGVRIRYRPSCLGPPRPDHRMPQCPPLTRRPRSRASPPPCPLRAKSCHCSDPDVGGRPVGLRTPGTRISRGKRASDGRSGWADVGNQEARLPLQEETLRWHAARRGCGRAQYRPAGQYWQPERWEKNAGEARAGCPQAAQV